MRAAELWRVPEPWLAAAQDDATALAIAEMERAGVDILTDGEIRRESYSNRFATALEGLDIDNPAMVPGRAGGMNAVPRVVGAVRRVRPVEVDDLRFLRQRTDRTVKITLPGPFTMSQQASDEFYGDEAALAMEFAAAVNDEVRDLFAAGADIVQIDEPWLQSRAEKARAFALPAINRALEGVAGHDRAAHVLRLRPRRPRPPGRLPVPRRAGRVLGGHHRHRGRAAAAGHVGARAAGGKTVGGRRARPVELRSRKRPRRSRRGSSRRCACWRRSASRSAPTAG